MHSRASHWRIVSILLCLAVTAPAWLGPVPGRAEESSDSASDQSDADSGSASSETLVVPDLPGRPTPSGVPTVEEAKPEQIYIRDKDGSLKLLLGWTMEQFEELVRLKSGLEQSEQPPRYVIEEVAVSGQARAEYAELSVKFRFRVRDDGEVRIPIRLDQAVLRGDVQYDGTGRVLLATSAQEAGYVLYFQGDSEVAHQLQIDALVRTSQVGDESRLRLSLPQATTSSLTLEVPQAQASASVTQGASIVSNAASEDGGTVFNVVGLSKGFELVWRGRKSEAVQSRPVLEVTGETLIKVGSLAVEYESRLVARSYGGPFDELQVRLPPMTDLIPITSTEYEVQPVSESETSEKGKLVEVHLPEPTVGPVELRLAGRRTADLLETSGWIELAGFEVPGAIRQSGFLGVTVVGDRLVVWGPSRGVRQVQEIPNWQDDSELIGGFEYFSQPFSLTARVLPRTSRITVQPEYRLDVSADKTTLSGTLKMDVRGAPVTSVAVAIAEWTIDEIGPASLVAGEGIRADAEGVVTVPLLERVSGEFELTLQAHMDNERSNHLELTLPRPQANVVNPGQVLVVPADNVELTPDREKSSGIVRLSGLAAWSASQGRSSSFVYRLEGSSGVFAADMVVREQEILTEVTAEVTVRQRQAEMEQRIRYEVSYVPRDRSWAIELPRQLAESGDLEINVNGRPVKAVTESGSEFEPEPGNVVQRIPLPSPLLGRMDVIFRYPVAFPHGTAESIPWQIPLVRPLDGKLVGQTLTVTTPIGIDVRRCQAPWEISRASSVGSDWSSATELTTTSPATLAEVSVDLRDAMGFDAVLVERAFVETWMDQRLRQDRAIYRIQTRQPAMELRLPPTVSPGATQVFLDDIPVQAQMTGDGMLVVPLRDAEAAAGNDLATYRVEVWYSMPRPAAHWGRFRLDVPQVGPNGHVRRMYWQVNLPGDEHIVSNFGAMTPEFEWGWTGSFWGRLPSRSEAELLDWVGAEDVTTPGSEAYSRYLFGSLHQVEGMEVWGARRIWIVGFSSLAFLAVGLALIYLPRVRRPATLLVLTVACAALVLISPAAAFLATQAGSLGVGVTLLAFLVQRGVTRKTKVYGVPDTTAIAERSTAETLVGRNRGLEMIGTTGSRSGYPVANGSS